MFAHLAIKERQIPSIFFCGRERQVTIAIRYGCLTKQIIQKDNILLCFITYMGQLTWRNRLGHPAHRINFSVCLFVCLFVCPFHMKTRRIFMQELKSGCPRGVFCPSSIPSKYLFLCTRRKFGFNKKMCTKLLVVYVYF